jgi:signal transduction histidine kinase
MRLSAQDNRGEIKVTIRDTGRGISEEELQKVFEPFYSTKDFGKGTGLGLAIVKRIVGEHGGDIQVQSRVGEGTVFTLLFPVRGLNVQEAVSSENFYYNKPDSSKDLNS